MLVQNNGMPGAGSGILGAIRKAASATGTSFEYLLATAQAESGLNPSASAATSTAGGLFQFIEQTWLGMLKEAGRALGYGSYADAIVKTPSGRFEVPDLASRRAVMALRLDPAANAAMAGAFTSRNAEHLRASLGRDPSEGELYIAHFLGVTGAVRLITLAAHNPGVPAADSFPQAARANPTIFYDRQGNPRRAVDVYNVLVGRYQNARGRPAKGESQNLASRHSGEPSTAIVPPASRNGPLPAARFVEEAPPVATKPIVQSLFIDEAQRGQVSQFIRELWMRRPRVAAALTGQPEAAGAPRAMLGPPLDLFAEIPPNARALFDPRM